MILEGHCFKSMEVAACSLELCPGELVVQGLENLEYILKCHTTSAGFKTLLVDHIDKIMFDKMLFING